MSDIVKKPKVKPVKKSTVVLQQSDITITRSKNPKYTVQLTNEHHLSSNVGNIAFFLVVVYDKILNERVNPKALIFTIDQYQQALEAFNDLIKCTSVKSVNETFKKHQNGIPLMNTITKIDRVFKSK